MISNNVDDQLKALQEQNTLLQSQVQQLLQQAMLPSDNAIHRVTVKFPPFWPDKPEVWFAQAEAQFALANITQDTTKYNYIVSQLDARFANEVDDIITRPPNTGRYERLKTELIRRLSLIEEQRVRQLISAEELGDRKPSQFLRHLRSLAGSAQVQDNLLRTLWLQRLPQQIQAILQIQSDLALDKLAELADKVAEVAPPIMPIATTAAVSEPPISEVNILAQRVEQLSLQIAALQNDRSLSHLRNRSRSHSRSRSSTDEKLCWYHSRFRDKANKCVSPCKFSPNIAGSQ